MSKVIQVRDVPDDVHEALVRQAKAEGLSLNQFVLREYEKIARRARQRRDLRAGGGPARPTAEPRADRGVAAGDRERGE